VRHFVPHPQGGTRLRAEILNIDIREDVHGHHEIGILRTIAAYIKSRVLS
jgi:hypothetical protein